MAEITLVVNSEVDLLQQILPSLLRLGGPFHSGEYIECLSDIQSAIREIRKILREIPILVSEQRLLDEANGHEEVVRRW